LFWGGRRRGRPGSDEKESEKEKEKEKVKEKEKESFIEKETALETAQEGTVWAAGLKGIESCCCSAAPRSLSPFSLDHRKEPS
jgi:hypothetical protein